MKTIKKILCALDLSEQSTAVAEYATTLAQTLGASIVALYVAPAAGHYVDFHVPPETVETFIDEINAGAKKSMNDFVAQNFSTVPVQALVVLGEPAEEILLYAEHNTIDLIVMGTHGRTGVDRMLFGSVAERVVTQAACPVLTLRPL